MTSTITQNGNVQTIAVSIAATTIALGVFPTYLPAVFLDLSNCLRRVRCSCYGPSREALIAKCMDRSALSPSLDKMPKSLQGRAKELIHEMYLSPTRKAALEAYDQFIASYQAKYPKATECLEKDKEWLFTFYDFPAQHWSHLRTTNPIESTFATVRLRTQRTKGCGSRIATLTMVFKLGIEAQKHWRRLNGSALLSKVVTGVQFIDGEELGQQAA
jgi:Transposase, Mutator family